MNEAIKIQREKSNNRNKNIIIKTIRGIDLSLSRALARSTRTRTRTLTTNTKFFNNTFWSLDSLFFFTFVLFCVLCGFIVRIRLMKWYEMCLRNDRGEILPKLQQPWRSRCYTDNDRRSFISQTIIRGGALAACTPFIHITHTNT